jgi:zinc protease
VLDIIVDVALPDVPGSGALKATAESITAIRQDDDNPAVQAVETLSRLYGPSHPYGRRAKGSADSLERILAMRSGDSYRYVRPAVLSLVIVGDVAAQRAVDLAAQRLEGWSGAPKRPIVVPPPHVGARRRVRDVRMAGKSQTDIAYGFTTISRLDPRYYAYWMMNNILGQFGLGGRLADNIREQGMAYYAFSSSTRRSAKGRS